MAGEPPVDRHRPRDEKEPQVKRTALMIALCCVVAAASVRAQDSVQKTRDRAEAAKGGECAKVCFEAARQLIEASNQLYVGGDVPQGLKLINDALAYAKKGTHASIESHKNQKGAEIALRKLAKRMHDVGQSLALDDRPPVFKAEESMNELRDEMLAAMFGAPKKTLEEKK
jgi:hypothetical protein